jgi:uncharacterized protein (TIGR00251 family)
MMDIQFKESAEGILLPVHARAGARRNGIIGVHGGRLKIAVTQIPEKGKANQEILRLLADVLDLPKSQVRLVAGETNSQKTICLSGISLEEIEHRLLPYLT